MSGFGRADDSVAIATAALRQPRLKASLFPLQSVSFIAPAETIDALVSSNSKVIFGRDGAGKTHSLSAIAEDAIEREHLTARIGLAAVSSAHVLFDEHTPTARLATQFAVGMLSNIHHELSRSMQARKRTPRAAHEALSRLEGAIIDVRLDGEQKRTRTLTTRETRQTGAEARFRFSVALSDILSLSWLRRRLLARESETTHQERGHAEVWLELGSVRQALEELAASIRGELFILLDDWHKVPLRIQPYLADLVGRLLWDASGCVVKIATVESRSAFTTVLDAGIVGFNPRPTDTVHLDRIYSDAPGSRQESLLPVLFAHARERIPHESRLRYEIDAFASAAFVDRAVEYLQEAWEGNPRDALLLASFAAERTGGQKIDPERVLGATHRLLYEEKSTDLQGDASLVEWFQIEVLQKHESRCFYVDYGTGRVPTQLLGLYNARLVHPGRARVEHAWPRNFQEWHIDYGLARDLITREQVRPRPIPPALPYDELGSAPIARLGLSHHEVDSEPPDDRDSRNQRALPPPATPPGWAADAVSRLPAEGTFLIVDEPTGARVIELTQSPVSIGRGGNTDVRLSDETVSREHAFLTRRSTAWELNDAGSKNGTQVNGKAGRRHVLADGALIQLSGTSIYFAVKDSYFV